MAEEGTFQSGAVGVRDYTLFAKVSGSLLSGHPVRLFFSSFLKSGMAACLCGR